MLQKKLPLLLVLPQSGIIIPPELHADPQELHAQENSAAFRLGESLNFPDRVEYRIAGELSPALLKLDAPRDDALAETWPDGTPIYALAKKNIKPLKNKLLADYYQGWHRRISEVLVSRQVKAALDCFVLPASEPSPKNLKSLRTILALGNQGDEQGEARPGSCPLSCPADLVRDLRDMLAARFSDLPGRVVLNPPLPGGHLPRLHARQPVPWIRFGVAPELLSVTEGGLDAGRAERLRERMEGVLVIFCKLQGWI